MQTSSALAEQINRLYPLQDQRHGTRYRIVHQLAGATELEAINGEPRYVPTHSLQDQRLWKQSA